MIGLLLFFGLGSLVFEAATKVFVNLAIDHLEAASDAPAGASPYRLPPGIAESVCPGLDLLGNVVGADPMLSMAWHFGAKLCESYDAKSAVKRHRQNPRQPLQRTNGPPESALQPHDRRQEL